MSTYTTKHGTVATMQTEYISRRAPDTSEDNETDASAGKAWCGLLQVGSAGESRRSLYGTLRVKRFCQIWQKRFSCRH